jgi:hypothetical protein
LQTVKDIVKLSKSFDLKIPISIPGYRDLLAAAITANQFAIFRFLVENAPFPVLDWNNQYCSESHGSYLDIALRKFNFLRRSFLAADRKNQGRSILDINSENLTNTHADSA